MKKHCIVTGAGRGLGRAISLDLAAREDVSSIALIARSVDELAETASMAAELNPRCRIEVLAGDLSSGRGTNTIISSLRRNKISYNVLINNAGYASMGSLEETTDEQIERTLFVNLAAPAKLIKFFLPAARAGKWGRIINISSISAFRPDPSLTAYIVSKSALKSLSECVSLSGISDGITCNTICPGLMLTEMGKESIRLAFPQYGDYTAPEIEMRIAEMFPSGRLTEPEEVARVISFLLSEHGGCISGEFFRVSSGLL